MLTYVETIAPDKSDSMHWKIKQLYDEDLVSSFDFLVRKSLHKQKVRQVELAIDCKRDLYWGKKSFNVVAGENDHGTNKALEWVVLTITKPHPMPLMALPLFSSAERAEKTIMLLKYARSLPIRIKRCYLDRGFYSGRLLAFLEANRIPYLMLAPSSSALKRYAEQTKRIAVFRHRINKAHSENDRAIVTIMVVIEKDRDPFYYATNCMPSLILHKDYKKRWQIETDFRVIGEAKIKSKSNFHIIRHFYFMLRLVMLLVWNVTKRITRHVILFKRFLLKIIRQESLPDWVT